MDSESINKEQRDVMKVQKKTLQSKENHQFLNIFWSLPSLNNNVQKNAIESLIKSLEYSLDHDPEQGAVTLDYSINRIMKGLESDRDDVRRGYTISFMNLLRHFDVDLNDIVDKIKEKSTESTNKISGKEERGIYFSALFSIMALLRSGVLKGNVDHTSKLITILFELSEKKYFLQEISHSLVCEALSQVSKKNISESPLKDILLEKLSASAKDWTPEVLSLALFLEQKFDYDISSANTFWKEKGVINSASIKKLSSAFHDSSASVPRIHSLWDYILPVIKKDVILLQSVWYNVIDEFFVGSNNKKYLGFALFQKLSDTLSSRNMTTLLTPNFINTLAYFVRDKSSYLHFISKNSLKSLVDLANADDDLCVAVVTSLQKEIPNFDIHTKTVTIKNLIKKMDFGSSGDYIESIIPRFYTENLDSKKEDKSVQEVIASTQMWVIEQLHSLCHNENCPESTRTWVMNFFLFHAFYSLKKKIGGKDEKWNTVLKYQLETNVRKRCYDKLHSLIALFKKTETLTKPEDFLSFKNTQVSLNLLKFQQELEESGFVELSESLFPEDEYLEDDADLSETRKLVLKFVLDLKKERTKISKKLKKSESIDSQKLLVIKQMISIENLILQLGLNMNVEPNKTTENLNEIMMVYQNLNSKNKEEDAINPIDVMTDVYISLLLNSNHTLRDVVLDNFKTFTGDITPTSLRSLLDVLHPGNFNEGEPENPSSSDSNDGESDDDDKTPKMDAMMQDDDSDEADRMQQDDSSDDDSSFEESSFDDEQMFNIDDKIAAVLKFSKQATKDDKKSLNTKRLHFKNRVFDLLNVFVKKEKANPVILHVILPALDIIEKTTEKYLKALMQRMVSLLNGMCKSKVVPKDIDPEMVNSLLESLILKLVQTKDKVLCDLTASLTLYVLKVIRVNKSEGIDLELIEKNMSLCFDCYMTKRTALNNNRNFLKQFFSQNTKLGISLFPNLVSKIDKGRNQNIKTLIFECLGSLGRNIIVTQTEQSEAKSLTENAVFALNNFGEIQSKYLKIVLKETKIFVNKIYSLLTPAEFKNLKFEESVHKICSSVNLKGIDAMKNNILVYLTKETQQRNPKKRSRASDSGVEESKEKQPRQKRARKRKRTEN